MDHLQVGGRVQCSPSTASVRGRVSGPFEVLMATVVLDGSAPGVLDRVKWSLSSTRGGLTVGRITVLGRAHQYVDITILAISAFNIQHPIAMKKIVPIV